MHHQLLKPVTHRILPILIISLLWGCTRSPFKKFEDENYHILTASINQPLRAAEAALQTSIQKLEELDTDQVKPGTPAWLKIDLESLTAMKNPALLLGHCLNVNQIAYNGQVLTDNQILESSRIKPERLRTPYLLLPPSDPFTSLFIQTIYSPRTGFLPDCHTLGIAEEEGVIQQFIDSRAMEMITGMIAVVLMIAALGIFATKHDLTYLYFALFSAALGLTYLLFSQVLIFLLYRQELLIDVWHFSAMSVPSLFLLFFQKINPSRSILLKRMALANLCAVIVSIYFYATQDWLGLESYRLFYILLLLPQIFFLILLIIRDYSSADASSIRILGTSFIVLLTLGTIDLAAYRFAWFNIYLSCWGVLLFFCLILVSLVQFFMEKERKLERDRLQGLEEYAQKLEDQVRNRSQSLKEQTELLQHKNEELQEKASLIQMSTKRMEELVGQKDALLKQAAEIFNRDLPPLNQSFLELKQNINRTEIQNLSIHAHRILSQLQPFGRLYEDIQAVNNKSIWLFEPSQELMLQYRSALGGSKVQLKSYNEYDILLRDFKDQTPDLAILNIDAITSPDQLKDQFSNVNLILTTSKELGAHIDFLEQTPFIGHVIHQDDDDRSMAQRNLLVAATKILSNDIFGLEKYLIWGVSVREQIVTSSRERATYVEQIESDLQKAGIQSAHIRNALLIAEEMLMNAIYDAPHDRSTGQAKYNHLSRRVAVDLEPNEYGQLRYALDGNLIAISVSDPFGALRRDIILKYLRSCFDGQFGKINEQEGKGGGGMGLFQILSTADLLITNIRPNQRTETIALISLQNKPQSRRRAGCFHYFVER